MNKKLCHKCAVILTDETGYRRNRGRQAGQLLGICRACSSQKAALYRAANPGAALVRERARTAANPEKSKARTRRFSEIFRARILFFKTERPCYDCGGSFPPESMDFDHVSGTKSFNVSTGTRRNWDAVRKEIDKCQLVCANCHRSRTKKRGLKNPQ